MSTNNNENALDFDALKETYGKPFFSDIENLRPNLPIDQTNVNISSLGPEFFTFFVEVDLKHQEGDSSKGLRRITPEFDMFEYEVFINVYIYLYIRPISIILNYWIKISTLNWILLRS
jgi:hypothetical protein